MCRLKESGYTLHDQVCRPVYSNSIITLSARIHSYTRTVLIRFKVTLLQIIMEPEVATFLEA